MKIMFFAVFAMMVTFTTLSAFAQAQPAISTASYSGTLHNDAVREPCRLTHGQVHFIDKGKSNFDVLWREEGFWQGPGRGACESSLDARLTPTGTLNVWTVTFRWARDISYGTATLRDGLLEINADFEGHSQLKHFNAKMLFKNMNKDLTYERRLDLWSGPSVYANGLLNH